MKDKFLGERRKLVKSLESMGIGDRRVLDAILKVKRHLFVLDESVAYEDRALSILCHQTISQPYTVAFMIQSLELENDDNVLEIGTGSGWGLAILSEIMKPKTVYSLEIHKELIEFAEENLKKAKIKNYEIFHRNGYFGLREKALFDKIIVTAAPKEIPFELIKQLKDHGIIIVPVGEYSQNMLKITKIGDNIIKQDLGNFLFVPMTK